MARITSRSRPWARWIRGARWAGLAWLVAGGCRAEPPQQAPAPGESGAAAATASNTELLPEEGELAVEVAPATAGVATTAHVRLTASHGYEINEKFHYKLTLEPTPGVTLPQTVFTRAEHQDGHELAIAMTLTADRAGDYTVHGKLDFAVCKADSQCRPKTVPVAVQLAAR
ncbi:MAG TPA: hypothetical protein VH165_36265 [Kofleriaceae bacterium]|jgi:hypothetical protein|nr:hypothetical protein [Kofleriaceae bacterium]